MCDYTSYQLLFFLIYRSVMYRGRWRNNFLFSRFESFENIAGDQRKLIVLILITTTLSILPVGYHIIVLNVPSTVIQVDFGDIRVVSMTLILSGSHLEEFI